MIDLEMNKLQIIEYGKKMLRDRLVHGTSGNLSLIDRASGLVFMTPTGTDYERLSVGQVAVMTLNGDRVEGSAPTSEHAMHLGIYRARHDVQAVVHTHSVYATTLAVHGMPIPAIHYMVTMLGGGQIPITPRYELYGTEELAQSAVETLGRQYHAALLRSHGVVAIGTSLAEAYARAVVVEEMAELYHHAKVIGEPPLLTGAEIQTVTAKISNYGKMKD